MGCVGGEKSRAYIKVAFFEGARLLYHCINLS